MVQGRSFGTTEVSPSPGVSAGGPREVFESLDVARLRLTRGATSQAARLLGVPSPRLAAEVARVVSEAVRDGSGQFAFTDDGALEVSTDTVRLVVSRELNTVLFFRCTPVSPRRGSATVSPPGRPADGADASGGSSGRVSGTSGGASSATSGVSQAPVGVLSLVELVACLDDDGIDRLVVSESVASKVSHVASVSQSEAVLLVRDVVAAALDRVEDALEAGVSPSSRVYRVRSGVHVLAADGWVVHVSGDGRRLTAAFKRR